MKLYYSPSACSLAPHIVLHELGLKHEAEKVDLRQCTTESGADFRAINPKGQVPTLVLDDGAALTEVAVLLQYLAAQAPEQGLIAAPDGIARWRQLEVLNQIATELHKGFGAFFNPVISDEVKAKLREQMGKKLDAWSATLDTQPYACGDAYTVADAYLFTVLRWARAVGVDLAHWPTLSAYMARIAQRPAVQATLAYEGISA